MDFTDENAQRGQVTSPGLHSFRDGAVIPHTASVKCRSSPWPSVVLRARARCLGVRETARASVACWRGQPFHMLISQTLGACFPLHPKHRCLLSLQNQVPLSPTCAELAWPQFGSQLRNLEAGAAGWLCCASRAWCPASEGLVSPWGVSVAVKSSSFIPLLILNMWFK